MDVNDAYLAGLVDGEGSISLPVLGSNRVAGIKITNTAEDLIDWVVAAFPVMRKYQRKNLTKAKAPRVVFEAVVTDREGLRVIVAAIRPYVTIGWKRDRLDAMWDWITNPPHIGKHEQEFCDRGHPMVTKPNGSRRCDVCNRRYQQEYRERKGIQTGAGQGRPGQKRSNTCKHGHDVSNVPVGKACPECQRRAVREYMRRRRAAS